MRGSVVLYKSHEVSVARNYGYFIKKVGCRDWGCHRQ